MGLGTHTPNLGKLHYIRYLRHIRITAFNDSDWQETIFNQSERLKLKILTVK